MRCAWLHPSERVRACWAAIAHWHANDRRFARLAKLHEGPSIDLPPVGTNLHSARRGEDERFAGSALHVATGSPRSRTPDVLPPTSLIQQHPGYRNRVRMGSTWQADAWTVLERTPDLPVAEVARRVGCSFAPAWSAAQDFVRLQGSNRTATS